MIEYKEFNFFVMKCCEDFTNLNWFIFFEKFNCYVFHYFVMKCCEDFKNHCSKFLKKFNSYVFNYFVIKCCEDFKNHCWKIWKSSVLMYSIILWWNAVRISKLIVERFEEKKFSSYVFYYFVIKRCEDFKNHSSKILNVLWLYTLLTYIFNIFLKHDTNHSWTPCISVVLWHELNKTAAARFREK